MRTTFTDDDVNKFSAVPGQRPLTALPPVIYNAPAAPYIKRGAETFGKGVQQIGTAVSDWRKTVERRDRIRKSGVDVASPAVSKLNDMYDAYQPDMSLTPPVHGQLETPSSGRDIYSAISTKYGNSMTLKPSDDPNDYPLPEIGPVTPKGEVMNWNPNGGDPTIPYRVGEQNMMTAVPRASAVPGREAPGVVAEARRRGIPIEGNGAVPGGNVSRFEMSADDQRKAQDRRESAVPAMASYMDTLDEANAFERIHGSAMARQAQMFKDKYGIDLRRNEFALKKQELAQQAPETAARAGYYNASAKKMAAEASAVPGKTKSYMAQFHINTANKLMDELVNPMTEETRKAEIRQSLTTIEAELNDLDAKNSGAEKPPIAGAQKAPDGKWYVKDAQGKYRPVITSANPSWEQFLTEARKLETNKRFSDDQLKQYYTQNYGG